MTILAADFGQASTRAVAIDTVRLAHRRLGPETGVPVVMLNHWSANLDNFDPAIVHGLAVTRPIHAIDYRGVGASEGQAPLTRPSLPRRSRSSARHHD